VIATGISPPQAGEPEPRVAPDRANEVEAGAADGDENSDNADGPASVETGAAEEPTCEPTTPAPTPDPVVPAPETTPAPPTGTTGPAEVDPGSAGKQGVAAAAASVSVDETSVAPPLVEGSSTGC
jgi:hypothetical protein